MLLSSISNAQKRITLLQKSEHSRSILLPLTPPLCPCSSYSPETLLSREKHGPPPPCCVNFALMFEEGWPMSRPCISLQYMQLDWMVACKLKCATSRPTSNSNHLSSTPYLTLRGISSGLIFNAQQKMQSSRLLILWYSTHSSSGNC